MHAFQNNKNSVLVCILKICQNLHILNILIFVTALDIFQLSKTEECYLSFSINICTQYRNNGFENRFFLPIHEELLECKEVPGLQLL